MDLLFKNRLRFRECFHGQDQRRGFRRDREQPVADCGGGFQPFGFDRLTVYQFSSQLLRLDLFLLRLRQRAPSLRLVE